MLPSLAAWADSSAAARSASSGGPCGGAAPVRDALVGDDVLRHAARAGQPQAAARVGQLGRERRGLAEQVALAERRAGRAGGRELLLGVDPLGQHGGEALLGLGADRGDDPRHVLGLAVAQQPQVELDHVGIEHRHQRERARVGADVVERDAPAEPAQLRERAQQRLRALGQRALGDLHDEREAGARRVGQVVLERARVGVDEQAERRAEAALDRAGQRGLAARAVELGDAALLARGGEQRLGRGEPVPAAAAGQRLVADDAAVAQVEDRLVDGLDVRGIEDAQRTVFRFLAHREH